jgi:transposase
LRALAATRPRQLFGFKVDSGRVTELPHGLQPLLTDTRVIVLADKAYDDDWLLHQIEAAGAAPNIPPMVHRRWKPCLSPVLYRARNRVERFFNRIKHFRRLATS